MPWEKNLSGVTEPTVFLDTGDEAPYNGETEYSINTEKAETLGFQFTNLKDWIYDLIDYYIKLVETKK